MNTTRRFPRTLAEAFPRDARHAYAIERHGQARTLLAAIASYAALAVLLAAGLVYWWGSA